MKKQHEWSRRIGLGLILLPLLAGLLGPLAGPPATGRVLTVPTVADAASATPRPATATALPATATAVPATHTATAGPATRTATVTAGPATATSSATPAAATATPACAADGWEPNDSPEMPPWLPGDLVVRDLTLCPAGDTDYFAADPPAGFAYTAVAVGDAGLVLQVSVTRAGVLLGQGTGPVSWDAPAGGAVVIRVIDLAPESSGARRYTLAVQARALPPTAVPATGSPTATATPTPTATATGTATVTPTASATPIPCLDAQEPDGTADQAQPQAVNGAAVRHTFCPAGDADWVAFYASRDKHYHIQVGTPGSGPLGPDVDPYFYLFDGDGRTVIDQADDTGASLSAQLDFVPLRDGVYYVQAKNKGDRGGPAASYSVQITLDTTLPTATGSAYPPPATGPSATPAPPTATAAPYTPPPAPPAVATASVPPTGGGSSPPVAEISPTATAIPPTPGILRIFAATAATGGAAYVEAGDPAALAADHLEAHDGQGGNDDWQHATPLDVGLLYRHLTLIRPDYNPTVAAGAQPSDHDWYTWRAKRADCYLISTSHITPGLDTTLQVLRVPGAGNALAAPTVLAGSDDRAPGSEDRSAAVWTCPGLDEWLAATVNLYGWDGKTDPRGKSYDFSILVNPPTPAPTRTARPTAVPAPPAPAPAPAGPSAAPPVPPTPVPATATPPSVPLAQAQVRCGATCTDGTLTTQTLGNVCGGHGGVASWLLCPVPTATVAAPDPPTPAPSPATPAAGSLSATPLPATATPTLPPDLAQALIVAYVDFNRNGVPDPDLGEAVQLRGWIMATDDVGGEPYEILARGQGDARGRLRLRWPAGRTVTVILPDLGRSLEVPAGTRQWTTEVQVPPPVLPGIIP